MTFETILYHAQDNVVTITLNRPEVMNGLNSLMRVELLEAVKRAPLDGRVLVLTGAGRGFCSGQDLGDAVTSANLDLEQVLVDEYEPMLKAIYNCPIPTIAAVNGPAVGAGANLALAADVVIATTSAVFIQAFARIGLIPDAGGTYWLPRQVGFAKAMGAALFTDNITAQQAEKWGMIWETVPDAGFADVITARASHLANGPSKTYEYIKQAIRASFDNNLDDQLALEARLQGKAGKTADFVEGVTAFMQKRKPEYQGR